MVNNDKIEKQEKPKKKAGRPKGSFNLKTAEARMNKEFKKKLYKNWSKLIDTELYLALGERTYQKIGGKKVIIFTRQPEKKALETLIAHVVGKPTEKVNLDVSLPVTLKVSPYKVEKK